MRFESTLAIAILKLGLNGPFSHEILKSEARLPQDMACKLLRKMQTDELLYLEKGCVVTDSKQRVKLAAYAVQNGGDIQLVNNLLRWKEFEEMSDFVFQSNGYATNKNVRFRSEGKRWEIDVVGYRRPLVICADCKHWQRGLGLSSLKKIVEKQTERTLAFARTVPSFEKSHCGNLSEKLKLIPLILVLATPSVKLLDNMPIVPILQLQSFLDQIPIHAHSVRFFECGFDTK